MCFQFEFDLNHRPVPKQARPGSENSALGFTRALRFLSDPCRALNFCKGTKQPYIDSSLGLSSFVPSNMGRDVNKQHNHILDTRIKGRLHP